LAATAGASRCCQWEWKKPIFCCIIKSPEVSEAKIIVVSGEFYLIRVSPEIENEIINLVIY